jgi:replication factor C subunit 1
MNNLWINKYKPSNLNEIIGNKNQIKRIEEWLKNMDTLKSMSLIVSGNHGIGKSLTLKYILEENNYLVKIIYPNEIKLYRNDEDFKDFFNYKNSIRNKIDFSSDKSKKKLALIFDETESITLTSEKKFITEIFKMNNKKKMFPLIFISNNQHSKLLNDLKKNCLEVRFVPPANFELKNLICKVLNEENIKVANDHIIDLLIDFSQSDIRKLINILQELNYHFNNKIITEDGYYKYIKLSKQKYNELGLFETTLEIINNDKNYEEINQFYENEKVLLPLMIHENYPKKVLSKSKLDTSEILDQLNNICDSISIGDNIETSIYTDQNWFLQKIHCFFSCVNSNYWINYSKTKDITLSDIKFSSDLNKTSLKNINKKNINNLSKLLPNKSLEEILYINKICNHLVNNNKVENIIDILKSYNPNFNIKDIELCIKIDKSYDFTKFNPKEKKHINKIIDSV